MSTEAKYFELITAYLKNELTKFELEAFEKELATNSALQKELAFQANLQAVWKEETALDIKSQFQTLEKELSTKQQDKPSTKPKSKVIAMRPILAIAASILLVAGFFFLQTNNSSADPFSKYFSDYPNELVSIERGESIEEQGQKAFVLYGEKKYQAALDAFSSLDLEGLDLYRAICYMHLSDYEKALSLLQNLDITNLGYTNQKAWYSALCYMKLGDYLQAKQQLEIVKNSKDSFRKKSAVSLINELSK